MHTILIGVSSGIAAFKAVELVRSLKSKGYNLIVIMTEKAKRMLSEKEFERASGNKVASELFPKGFDYRKVLKERKVEHISLAEKASVICVVPATANIIAKTANGIADDLLSTTILASKANILFCPSMNVNMWNNEITKKNIEKIKQRGYFIVEPEYGMLACGCVGKGRLADITKIENGIINLAEKKNEFKGKKVIVTAGGTEEEIDDVRVITNKSSGKMGIRIAEEFVKRGAEVTLIRARTEIEPNVLLKDIKAQTADEMLKEIRKVIKKNDVIVHAAAVADFKAKKITGKIKSDKKTLIELTPNTKIISEIKKLNKKIFLVGFKAEHNAENLEKIAFNSLKKYNCGMIVANDVGKNKVFGSDYNEVIIVDKKGNSKKDKKSDKGDNC